MVMLMYKGGATMRSAGFVKNAAIYSICIVFAWWLSSFGKPLNGLTQWVMDTAYSTFGSGRPRPPKAPPPTPDATYLRYHTPLGRTLSTKKVSGQSLIPHFI